MLTLKSGDCLKLPGLVQWNHTTLLKNTEGGGRKIRGMRQKSGAEARWGRSDGREILSMRRTLPATIGFHRVTGAHELESGGGPYEARMTHITGQQGNRNFSPTTKQNWILPITWMNMEADASSKLPERDLALPTPWFPPCETQSREPAQPCYV